MRPLCKCGQRPRSINYYKNGKPYYRKLCNVCNSYGINHRVPRWQRSGYCIKNRCDRFGFSSPHSEEFRVFHVDGDLNNCRHVYLKDCMLQL